MSDRDENSPEYDAERLRDLERRLGERMSERSARAQRRPHAPMGALGAAWRMSVELVAALVVGGLLGLGLDRLFSTQPWIMIAGLLFGFAAGIRNAVRTAYSMQMQPPTGGASEGAPTDDDGARD